MEALVISGDMDVAIAISDALIEIEDMDFVYAAQGFEEASILFDDETILRAIFIHVDIEDNTGSEAYAGICDEYPELLEKVMFVCKEESGLVECNLGPASITLPVSKEKIEEALENV